MGLIGSMCCALMLLLWESTVCLSQPLQLVNAFPNLTFTQPVFLTHSNDGTNRIFVVQKNGLIRVFPNDSAVASASTFLNLSSRIITAGGSSEQGLLGLAFHPNYANNGYFYVDYTQAGTGRTIVARYSVTPGNPNTADFNSELILLNIYQPYSNHNGGMLFFGQDGYLYIGMGDGGSAGDPGNRAQNVDSLLGKILRINVDTTIGAQNYGIPPTNPFASGGGRPEIFAWGMRNPWRFSQDPVTGVIWCGDVGQGLYEEIDLIQNGNNYGWRIMEGLHCYNPSTGCNQTGLTLPIKEYTHSGGRCSITGGYVYRGWRRPDLVDRYIYADYCTGEIFKLRYQGGVITEDALLLSAGTSVLSFGTDQNNELYTCGNNGTIYRFNSAVPTIAVISPTGGTTWAIGSTQNIQWTSANISGNVTISLSRDGGLTFPEIVAANTPNDGAESWTVTGPATPSARIKVTSVTDTTVAAISGADFVILQPSITVSVPNGGETWGIGSVRTIQWSSTGLTDPVMIELSRDSGSTFETLFASTPNDGNESWMVTGPPASHAIVKISSVTLPAVSDISNGPFVINSPFALISKLWIRDNAGSLDSLEWGTAAGATDGIDPQFGEEEVPPLPPLGVFDVRWRITGTEGTKRDIRDTLGGPRTQIIYRGALQPGDGGYPIVLRWRHSDLPSGTFTLRDGPGMVYFNVNMKLQDSIVITNEDVISFQLVYDATDVVYAAVQQNWNIISVPVSVDDLQRSAVFPTSVSNAYAFTPSGYASRDTLSYGTGYWLKFPSTQVISVSGGLVVRDTISVIQGWNMIGSISSPVPVGSIVQIPAGIISSQFFGYASGAYSSSTVINPMQGYWVKVTQNGKLVLPAPVTRSEHVHLSRQE